MPARMSNSMRRRIPIGTSYPHQSIHVRRTCMLIKQGGLLGGFPSGSRHGQKKWNGKTISNPNEDWRMLDGAPFAWQAFPPDVSTDDLEVSEDL